jgi:predicted nucleotidyltransferase component of viral defense system
MLRRYQHCKHASWNCSACRQACTPNWPRIEQSQNHFSEWTAALYLNYIGPLGGDLSSRFFKTDFTRDEVLLFPLVEAPLHVPYSDCRSRNQTIRVYSPEEILAEKLCALLGRTEPRDLYDVHYILEHSLADTRTVSFRLDEKMGRNKVDHSELENVLARKEETLRRLWEPRLKGQMPDLPHLDAVIRETNRWLRQAGLIAA